MARPPDINNAAADGHQSPGRKLVAGGRKNMAEDEAHALKAVYTKYQQEMPGDNYDNTID